MAKIDKEFLDRQLQRIIQKKKVYSAVLSIESGDKRISWTGAAGDMEPGSRYFIASVTKLYVTAVFLQFIGEGKIQLSDKISKYIPDEYMRGLHILKGVDHSQHITVKHLISNTSGLPDYFFHKQQGGATAAGELLSGRDETWTPDKTLAMVKEMTPRFAPGQKGKAAYSDTNYQLLGLIMEAVTGKPVSQVFKEYIFDKLGFQDTYVYSDINDQTVAPFYYKTQKLWLPKYMATIGTEGGIVSTASEMMVFLREFFNGRFFPKEEIGKLKEWNLILPPPGMFLFGIGLEKLWIPRIFNMFKPVGEVMGFWGQTGSFAWYNPKTDLFFCGTTNQIDGSGHRAATSAMLDTIKASL